MKTPRPWRGVRMRRVLAAPAPDAAPRLITIPAPWEDSAAAGLAALAPGSGAVRLSDAAEAFIRPLAERAAEHGVEVPLGERLHSLLLARRGAADAPLWQHRASGSAGFVLNLAAFADADAGFLPGAFGEAVEAASLALALAPCETRRPALRIADLAGLFALLGLDYDSAAARDLGAEIARLLRAHAEKAAPHTGRAVALVLDAPGPAEALLGVETGGIAPAFSPLRDDGRLTRSARAFLAARGISAESALAEALQGRSPFPEASRTAHAMMRERMLPFFDAAAPMPEWAPASLGRRTREAPPSPSRGYVQKVSVGGHKLTMRTGEYADGRLAEFTLAIGRQGPLVRNLLDALGAAVSVALQHGVALSEFSEAFLTNDAGTVVAVEGDPRVPRVTSVLDYAFRNLAMTYQREADLPPLPDASPAAPAEPKGPGQAALLPLELPLAASPEERRRSLRLVAK